LAVIPDTCTPGTVLIILEQEEIELMLAYDEQDKIHPGTGQFYLLPTLVSAARLWFSAIFFFYMPCTMLQRPRQKRGIRCFEQNCTSPCTDPGKGLYLISRNNP
jgi:hypothetical protein